MFRKRCTNLLKFCIVYLKLFGLYPISLGTSKISVFDLIYGTLLEVICLFYYFSGNKTSPTLHPNEVSEFTAKFDMLTSVLFTFFAHIFLYFRCKILLKTHNQLLAFSRKMNEETFYRKMFYTLLTEVFVVLIIMTGYFYVSNVAKSPNSQCTIFDFFIEIRWAVQFSALNLLFANVLFFALEMLKNVHSKLIKLREVQSQLVVTIFDGGKYKLEEEYNVDFIIPQYNDVISLCKNAHIAFGPTMAVSTIQAILDLICDCYYFVANGFMDFPALYFWMSLFMGCLWMVLFACESVVVKVTLMYKF